MHGLGRVVGRMGRAPDATAEDRSANQKALSQLLSAGGGTPEAGAKAE